ncbi:hybrid sensor histidine kinase/response regulator [Ferrigenium kumadai]|uniref:Chemotaxis protein CheA n=1 Tax=Ferrigenium kumadai TaxID=1682490 RepID=A0AAN1VZA5_9PROT|nr:hybrid sensor histidine kinase/response regulator [Ferrigenium kumadai]BBI99095.1 hybrid sensor histidine kinase/response regulator [Ferrigenium kumadai]
MIEDKELRSLFKIESEERLQHLDTGLLRLEETPSDLALLEDLFREAHSLKGAARMLGLIDIQTLSHQLEDALGAARKGEALLQAEAVASMNKTLEAIRRLVQIEIGETATPVGAVQKTEQPPVSQPGTEPAPTIPQQAIPQPATSQPAAPKQETFRIETIRVDPKKLDALMTQAGELTVTKIRIARRLAEVDELLDYCEEWERALHAKQANASEQIAQRLESLQATLSHLRGGAYEDSARLDFVSDQLESGIRTMRLLPMSTLFVLFPRLVHDLAQELHKEVELVLEGQETVADKRVLEEMKDPLMHMLRNAIGHGIESPEQRAQAGKPRSGTIRVKASQTPAGIVIEVSDDGRGLDLDEIRRTALKHNMYREDELAAMSTEQLQSLILVAGFSTVGFVTELSGRGVGLDVVRNNVEQLKGELRIESVPGKGMTLRTQLPVSLATVQVLVVAANGYRYALPVEHVQFSRKVELRSLYTMEGKRTISLDAQAISVAWLTELLDITSPAIRQTRGAQAVSTCVVLTVGEERFGLMVDDLIDELEVVLKPQGKLLKRVRNVAGATILETGEVCMVLNPHDLLKTLRKSSVAATPVAAAETAPARKVLLLAEDSITTRTQEKRILEGAGYEVVTAVDGADAYNKLGSRSFDAVVSDIVMPNMTGLDLTEKIRADKKYTELPIILVTSLASEEDQRRGLEAGANAYIAKPSFDQQVLLECLARLI